MEELIKSEGFWACVGALIGAISTYFITMRTYKVEVKKQKAIFLQEKQKAIQEAIGKINLLKEWSQYSTKDLLATQDLLICNAHYFNDDFESLLKSFNKIIGYMNDESEDIYTEECVETSRIIAVHIADVKNYMLNELKITTNTLKKLFDK